MVAHAQRVRHDGQAGVHGCYRHEEACVDHVKIVQIVRLTVHIQRRCLRIETEPNGSCLVRSASDRNVLAQVKRTGHQHIMTGDLAEHGLELCGQALVRFQVGVPNVQHDLSIRVYGDAIIESGKSSDCTQKSMECSAMKSSANSGFQNDQPGASPLSISASVLPSIWISPSGYSQSSERK